MKTSAWLLALPLTLTLGCSDPQPFGEPCTSDDDCRSRLCVTARQHATKGMCTKSCATDDDCPRGNSCSGATNKNVVVCLPGASTPFGNLPRAPAKR